MKLPDFYKNKVILITGSSMGIGKELANQALKLGASVVITGRNLERLEKTQNEFSLYKNKVMIYSGDIAEYRTNAILIEKIVDRFGSLDVVITNAGLSCFGEVEIMEPNVAKQIIDTNIYGSLFPVMAALNQLKKSKGSVLFISSIAGFYGLPNYSAYSLSKMALKALAQSLAAELFESGVFVGIAYVGFTENEEDKKTLSPHGAWQKVPKRNPAFTASRSATTLKLLNQIKHKQFSKTHSFIGKATEFMTRFFPTFTLRIIRWNYMANHKENID
jgi:short-subunit dehydrogenase